MFPIIIPVPLMRVIVAMVIRTWVVPILGIGVSVSPDVSGWRRHTPFSCTGGLVIDRLIFRPVLVAFVSPFVIIFVRGILKNNFFTIIDVFVVSGPSLVFIVVG